MKFDMREHPEDMRYAGPLAPDGVCRNRYCPEPVGKRDDLVRGYCPPCASIRVAVEEYSPAKRMRGDDIMTVIRGI